MVSVRCMNRDVVKYTLMSALILFRGQKHSVEVAVNPHLQHPLILGTNWPAFSQLLGYLSVNVSCGERKLENGVEAQVGEAKPGQRNTEPGERSANERLILPERGFIIFPWNSPKMSQ